MKNVIRKFIDWLFNPICHKCKKGRIRFTGIDYVNNNFINVYECSNCNRAFV